MHTRDAVLLTLLAVHLLYDVLRPLNAGGRHVSRSLFELLVGRGMRKSPRTTQGDKRAFLLTAPLDNRGWKWRCYMPDPDGYLIEVGQYPQIALDRFKNDAS